MTTVDTIETYSIVSYKDMLYRVEPADSRPILSAPYKFFTTKETEALAAYSRGGGYLYRYNLTTPLNLLNISELQTRNYLYNRFTDDEKRSLNASFPIREDSVGRNSDGPLDDYAVMTAICRLFQGTDIAGYYIPPIGTFHSEVAICQPYLNRLVISSIKHMPDLKPKGKSKMKSRLNANDDEDTYPLFGGRRTRRRIKRRTYKNLRKYTKRR